MADDFEKMVRMVDAEEKMAKMFGMEPAARVVMRQTGKVFGIIMTVSAKMGVLAGKTEVNLTDAEGEEEAMTEWCTEVAGLVTAMATSFGVLSSDKEYGFLRTADGGWWQFIEVPRLDTEADVACYLMAENESCGKEIIAGNGLPTAEDMEGWKKLIMMISNRIFGYIKK